MHVISSNVLLTALPTGTHFKDDESIKHAGVIKLNCTDVSPRC